MVPTITAIEMPALAPGERPDPLGTIESFVTGSCEVAAVTELLDAGDKMMADAVDGKVLEAVGSKAVVLCV